MTDDRTPAVRTAEPSPVYDRSVLPPSVGTTMVGQATSIEQSRAVAEVQAAVVVAQQRPRSVERAIAAMHASCSQLDLAEAAFYRYPRSGKPVTGPTIHLATELARCWGNLSYGMTELSRDDHAGQSEMLAFAWDLETNTQQRRSFIVPHRRTSGEERVALLDDRDIYENNTNLAARRMRETILRLLPRWYVKQATEACRATIKRQDSDTPIEMRRATMVRAFDGRGITQAQMEEKLGRKVAEWTPEDLVQLHVIGTAIANGETTREEEFPLAREPQRRITPDEVAPPAKRAAAKPPTDEVPDPKDGEDPWT